MNSRILMTGATGCIGRAVAAQLRGGVVAAKRYEITEPNLGMSTEEGEKLAREVEVIIHAAADTRFNASYEALRRTNVIGTENVLRFAGRCSRLRKFVHLSTTCVAGKRVGIIHEEPLTCGEFVNAYERTKHEAEHLVLESKLPTQIVRLATVLGSEADGTIPRWGAAHMTLYFLYRGLIAMVPGHKHASLDFISSELAGKVVVAAALARETPEKVVHATSGAGARLPDFLDFAAERFGRRTFVKPPIVDEQTFRMFRQSVRASRDLLFNQVLSCTECFLPGLLYPKIHSARNAEALLGEPLPVTPWRDLAGKVIDHCLATDWRKAA